MAKPIIRVFVFAKLPFCCESEIFASMEYADAQEITHQLVPAEVAELIRCHCCGFDLADVGLPATLVRRLERR
jgi:hypothetical protein